MIYPYGVMLDAQRQQTVSAACRYAELCRERQRLTAELARLAPLVARHEALSEQLRWVNTQCVETSRAAETAADLLITMSATMSDERTEVP